MSDERRALADRLDADAKVLDASDYVDVPPEVEIRLRAAAAALREDAELDQRQDEEILRLMEQRDYWSGRCSDVAAERDAALAEVARLREGIEAHARRHDMGAFRHERPADRELWALLDTEGADR